jgi:hypothetical protein
MARRIVCHAGTNSWTLCPGSWLKPGQKSCQQDSKGLRPFCPGPSLQPGQKVPMNRDKRPRALPLASGRRVLAFCHDSRLGPDKGLNGRPVFY